MTEYLYEKDNPKSYFRTKISGAQGFFQGVPNVKERAEMVARALAKENEGDISRLVNTMRKPRDYAQKWRAFKNIARLTKNPLGYMYWKTQNMAANGRIKILYVLAFYHMYCTYLTYVTLKNKKERMMSHWYWRLGEITKTHGAKNRPRRMPADRKKNYVRYSNFHQKLKNKRISNTWLNWWCRDQNFRKYFEMRKRHDIRPSLSGFANDKIYKETNAKNKQIYEMRQSYKATEWQRVKASI